MTDTFHLTPHESVTVVSHTPEALELEASWGPGGSPPPAHFHPTQDERIELLEGVLRARVDGHDHELRAGEVVEVPRRVVHKMWNEGAEPARALWRTSPAGRTAAWMADLHELRSSGRVRKNGMPDPLAFGVYLTEYRDVIRLAGPQPLVRGALAALGGIGRLRGYRVSAAATAR